MWQDWCLWGVGRPGRGGGGGRSYCCVYGEHGGGGGGYVSMVTAILSPPYTGASLLDRSDEAHGLHGEPTTISNTKPSISSVQHDVYYLQRHKLTEYIITIADNVFYVVVSSRHVGYLPTLYHGVTAGTVLGWNTFTLSVNCPWLIAEV